MSRMTYPMVYNCLGLFMTLDTIEDLTKLMTKMKHYTNTPLVLNSVCY
jgi:hypothetical protein